MKMLKSAILCQLAFIIIALIKANQIQGADTCDVLWSKCRANILLMSGAYCFNDGTGLCKAFSGRFEYTFNTKTNTFIGPVPESEFVDKNGYHKRVPNAYTIDGQIVYVDESLNWAEQFVASRNESINLLSISDINWCAYTANNYWPYKSAIKDPTGNYHIYFFNRQSCIFQTSTRQSQHFNTRFMHKSGLRLDLDMNPTIFAMQDFNTNDIRLVKHIRQHWYEVKYNIVENPTKNLRFFMQMDDSLCDNCKINRKLAHILPKGAYSNVTDVCLNDDWQTDLKTKNAKLFPTMCGTEKQEIADRVLQDRNNLYEVNLHNIPRGILKHGVESFYGVDVREDSSWEEFAKDGLVFTATTTVPSSENDTVKVIKLYAKFLGAGAADQFDEFYPMPYLSVALGIYKPGNGNKSAWSFVGEKATEMKYLNYVDDIAYLPACKSILAIFGPLYSEYPASTFETGTAKAPIGAITKLGMWELTNAFFAEPKGDNILWAYHRTNYVGKYQYKCDKPLVTASMANKKYYLRHGANHPPSFYSGNNKDFSEEFLFAQLGIFKGSLSNPEPPDPSLYKSAVAPPADLLPTKDDSWIWYVVAVAIIILAIMLAICFLTVRRWRKKRMLERSMRSSYLGNSSLVSPSVRSGMTRASGGVATHRSGLSSNARASAATARSSGLRSRPGSRSSRSSNTKTKRSQASSLAKPSGASSGTRRSGASSSGPGGSSSRQSRSSASPKRSSTSPKRSSASPKR